MPLPRFARNLAAAGLMLVGGTVAASAADAVASTTVNVRSGPGTGYGVVDVLRPGEPVNVDRCSGVWCYVQKSGPDGWVNASYLVRDDGPRYVAPPRASVDFFVGRPYRPFPHRPYWDHRWDHRWDDGPNASFCLGNPHASFCLSN